MWLSLMMLASAFGEDIDTVVLALNVKGEVCPGGWARPMTRMMSERLKESSSSDSLPEKSTTVRTNSLEATEIQVKWRMASYERNCFLN
ncbi:unnamed protein product [Protopolystoma xenopodis]|uniref:Uncharacterized protein n=1 Tax=Protopolystoma xenopodis TaxID=117903 RepID=A0A3S5CJJ8_9PLAT|nr:unnamed protein product [Protopolystoma xenopodis]